MANIVLQVDSMKHRQVSQIKPVIKEPAKEESNGESSK